MMRSNAADKSTGNDKTPKIAVTKNAHIVRGILKKVIPSVLKFMTVVI